MEVAEMAEQQPQKVEMMRLLAKNQISYSKQIELPADDLVASDNNVEEVFTAA